MPNSISIIKLQEEHNNTEVINFVPGKEVESKRPELDNWWGLEYTLVLPLAGGNYGLNRKTGYPDTVSFRKDQTQEGERFDIEIAELANAIGAWVTRSENLSVLSKAKKILADKDVLGHSIRANQTSEQVAEHLANISIFGTWPFREQDLPWESTFHSGAETVGIQAASYFDGFAAVRNKDSSIMVTDPKNPLRAFASPLTSVLVVPNEEIKKALSNTITKAMTIKNLPVLDYTFVKEGWLTEPLSVSIGDFLNQSVVCLQSKAFEDDLGKALQYVKGIYEQLTQQTT